MDRRHSLVLIKGSLALNWELSETEQMQSSMHADQQGAVLA